MVVKQIDGKRERDYIYIGLHVHNYLGYIQEFLMQAFIYTRTWLDCEENSPRRARNNGPEHRSSSSNAFV